MDIEIPKYILEKMETFDATVPFLRDPYKSLNSCVAANETFAELFPNGKTLHLLGNLVAFPRRVDEYPTIDPHYYHCVALVDGLVFDWSRRQLDPNCRHPYVQHLADVEREWLKVSERLSEIL